MDRKEDLENSEEWSEACGERASGKVFSMDIYPVGHPWFDGYWKLNAVSEGFKIQRDFILADMGDAPQRFILQGCALGDVGGTSPLEPTEAQTRFMAFDVITQGAKGIEWYGTNHLERTSEAWAGICTVAGELAAIQNELSAGTTVTSSASQGCHALAKRHHGAEYVIVTNPTKSNKSGVSISANGISGKAVLLFEDEPAINISGGSFSDAFGPWGVHVYGIDEAAPFGSFDSPTPGSTVDGSVAVTGWALTPQPNAIPTNGQTISVYVDGEFVGHPTYNVYREDIAGLFPGYVNSNGAAGYLPLNTTLYENGVHTIQWVVSDNAGNTEGIGSRFFTIDNEDGPQVSDPMVVDEPAGAASLRGFAENRSDPHMVSIRSRGINFSAADLLGLTRNRPVGGDLHP